MILSTITFSTEGQGYDNNPAAALIDAENTMTDGEYSEISSMLNKMEGIKAELQAAMNDPSLTQQQKIDAGNNLSVVNGNISNLRAAKSSGKSGFSASILSAAGIANELQKHNAEGSQSSSNNFNSEVLMSSAPLSTADRSFVRSSFTKDLGWYGGLDEKSKQWIDNDIASMANRDPEFKAGLTAARTVSENTVMNDIHQKNIDENKVAVAAGIQYAKQSGDKELLAAMESNQKLIQSRQKANDYTFGAQWNEAMKDGVITAEERKGIIEFSKQEAARRKEDFKEIDKKVFEGMPKAQRAALDKLYISERGGAAPTNEQLQQFIKDAKPDTMQVNHALAVMNKHAPQGCTHKEREAALAMLSPDQRKAFLLATSQTNMQVAEIAYDMKEFLGNVDGKDREQLIAEMQKNLKEGNKEGIIAMMEKANGDKALSPATIKMIQNSSSTEELAKMFEEAQKVGKEKGAFRVFRDLATPDSEKGSWNAKAFNFTEWFSYVQKAGEITKAVETSPIVVSAVPQNYAMAGMLKEFKPPATPIASSEFSIANNNNLMSPTTGLNPQLLQQPVAVGGR